MNTSFKMIAKTFQGLEEVLANELINIGANDIEIQRRAVSFTGDQSLLYKANLHLRTASRVLKPILVFNASNADQVYEQVKKINWNDYLSLDSTFSVDSTVYSDKFHHSKFVTYKVKDAIADWFNEKYNRRPSVSITAPQLMINIHISQTVCTLSLDSSGESLHKRGYRVSQTDAPINEALAAGMLLLAGWDGKTDFLDPMCGSGTLLIEAALIALNIPPGIYRKEFAFEKWTDFNEELFDSLYNDESYERPFMNLIYGSDISPKAIKVAEQNIKSAGLGKYIKVEIKALQQLKNEREKVLIVTNPPYGERISSFNINDLYAGLGTVLKHQFNNTTAWVISSSEEALKRVGLKPEKKIKLMNGSLECLYCSYTIFSGKRNDFVRNRKK